MGLLTDAHGRGVFASRPAAGHAGREYYSTDTSVTYRDNGSSWDAQATAGFTNPMTTAEDIIYGGASGAPTRKAKGSDGTFLGVAGGALGYAAVTDALLSTSDITTNNASTTKHGFAPKYPNDATKYLDGTGAYTVPAGAGGGGSAPWSTSYSTGSDTIWASSSSTTTADIDATNAALAITVPASGKIVVIATLDFTFSTANTGGYLVLRQGSTDLQASALITHNSVAGGIGGMAKASGHAVAHFAVSGLTPGALTIKLGFRRLGSAVLEVYANDGTGAAGHLASPFVMTAFAA